MQAERKKLGSGITLTLITSSYDDKDQVATEIGKQRELYPIVVLIDENIFRGIADIKVMKKRLTYIRMASAANLYDETIKLKTLLKTNYQIAILN